MSSASAKKSKNASKITPRSEDYARWYQDVVRQGDLAEAAEVVRGCMVIKPHGYAIWEKIQRTLDDAFKATGHQNAYFPMLIPQSFLQKEAEHVEGFSPELAVVTHAGGKKLEEPYVVRPTSETIIGHFFSKWVESWRDLPLLINQWANVMRWELRTRMFLRTSEFLWQEGHTAHATHKEAQEEVRRMLKVYADFCESTMAMPVICGKKTQTEKFAGAQESLCIEAMMQDGRALQAGTSHDLGQNFGRAFDVKFQNKDGDMEYVWQTSWGVSTRLVGGLVMTHSDDAGLVLPPKLAPVQVVIIPILKKGEEERVLQACQSIEKEALAAGIRIKLDVRDYKPGFKFFEWEQKGVPIRLELGPKDLDQGVLSMKLRTKEGKTTLPISQPVPKLTKLLDEIQNEMFAAALTRREENTHIVDSYSDFKEIFANEKSAFVWAHWDGDPKTEAQIKNDTKATIRCIPLDGDQPHAEPGVCMVTGKPSLRRVLLARNY